MNLENRWVKKAAMIPWKEIEEKYSRIFKSTTGMVAKSARVALGAFIDTEATGIFRLGLKNNGVVEH